MLEAAHALGIDDTRTLEVGKSMVDHALDVGWDDEAGGFYDIVYYLPGDAAASVIEDTKTWWAQARRVEQPAFDAHPVSQRNACILFHASKNCGTTPKPIWLMKNEVAGTAAAWIKNPSGLMGRSRICGKGVTIRCGR